jgi:hypothetical protein
MSCPFLLPGGNIGHRYGLQFYLVKKHKIANISKTTNGR